MASHMLECSEVKTDSKTQWKTANEEGKKVVVEQEMKRMHQLPVNSSYASHRIRVLNKILQLMSIQDLFSGRGAGVALCWFIPLISKER